MPSVSLSSLLFFIFWNSWNNWKVCSPAAAFSLLLSAWFWLFILWCKMHLTNLVVFSIHFEAISPNSLVVYPVNDCFGILSVSRAFLTRSSCILTQMKNYTVMCANSDILSLSTLVMEMNPLYLSASQQAECSGISHEFGCSCIAKALAYVYLFICFFLAKKIEFPHAFWL